MKDINRLYSEDLDKLPYSEKKLHKYNLHWGQRKLLMSEIEFLTDFYDSYDQNTQKYFLYVGASPGHHINYLIKMFPDIYFILYDPRRSYVELGNMVEIHQKLFTNEDALKYKNMNLFFCSDIRSIRNLPSIHKTKNKTNRELKRDVVIFDDMAAQFEWTKIINPKKASLKFRASWQTSFTEYFDGLIYFQVWHPIESIEMRLIPFSNLQIKKWNNKKIEEICYYYNNITRIQDFTNPDYICMKQKYESMVEASILANYLKKFMTHIENHDIPKIVCDMSISITMYLLNFTKNKVSSDFLKIVDPIPNLSQDNILNITF
jgi:hypothetical protein